MFRLKISFRQFIISVFAILALNVYLLTELPSSSMEIYILDVGQGDSILIKTQDEQYILVDGGPDEKALAQLQGIIPFWDRSLDLVILTHPDQDHVGGLPAVLNYYDVQRVAFHSVEHENKAYEEFQNIVQEKGIDRLELRDNDDFRMGCCTDFDILWPYEETNLEDYTDEINDISLSFVLVYKDFQMFFGGDLGAEHEEMIFEENSYDLDVLKVGHHGSKSSTSADFLDMITPEIAVISVGEDNRYGHPDSTVLDSLKKRNIRILRTDQEGMIILKE